MKAKKRILVARMRQLIPKKRVLMIREVFMTYQV